MARTERQQREERLQALFERYEWHAKYSGDADPKKAVATAKRTATSLEGAADSFGKLLDASQLEALRGAAATMRQLASDLEAVAKKAKQRKVDHDADTLAKKNAALDAIASDRWHGDDGAMLSEARELAAFVDNWQSLQVGEWVRVMRCPAHVKYPGVELLPEGGHLISMLARFTSGESAGNGMQLIRRRAAEYLQMLMEQQQRGNRIYKDSYTVALEDFEAWKTWRSDIRATVMPAPKA